MRHAQGEHRGVNVVAVGYKYNSKKVLFFVMTKGAGSTEPGEPYVIQFTSPLLSAPVLVAGVWRVSAPRSVL